MAKIILKTFGVFRSDTGIAKQELNVQKVSDLFPVLNAAVDMVYDHNKELDSSLERPSDIRFKDAIVYVNGEKVTKKGAKLSDGDEIWIMSPASGG